MAMHLDLSALLLAAKPARRQTQSSTILFLRHFGGIGLVPLAIVDSTIIPTFGSLDLLTAWLAVGNPDLWWYYAAMSTTGALIGAIVTYRMGRRMGSAWVEKKIGTKRRETVEHAIHRWGFGSIFVPVIAPPPFPTAWFLLGAGAFSYPQKKFVVAVLLGRGLRYSLLTMVAAHYGRHFLRYLRHPLHYVLISVIVTASLIAAVYLFGRRRPAIQATAATPAGTS